MVERWKTKILLVYEGTHGPKLWRKGGGAAILRFYEGTHGPRLWWEGGAENTVNYGVLEQVVWQEGLKHCFNMNRKHCSFQCFVAICLA